MDTSSVLPPAYNGESAAPPAPNQAPSMASYAKNKQEEMAIDVFDVKTYNILILGESRAGKTTFRKVLRNMNYVTKMEVWRGTLAPVSKSSLFSINKEFISINMLDTPGFAEASTGINRTDDAIRNMITEYVKRDITRIDLILIAINGSSGVTASNIANITSVLKFLGRQVSSRTCLLITHFESKNIEDEKKWEEDFKSNPNMRFLTLACQGGFLFTGALDKNQFNNVPLRDSYIIQQRRRNILFFHKLMYGESVSLLSPQMKDAKCMLAMQESVLTSCMNLRNLIPELENTWHHAINTRLKISNAINAGLIKDQDLLQRAEKIANELGDLGAEGKDIKTMKLDENVVTMLTEYEKIGESIREKYNRVVAMNNEFNEKDQKATLLWNELEWRI
jgi:hypothetical protein